VQMWARAVGTSGRVGLGGYLKERIVLEMWVDV